MLCKVSIFDITYVVHISENNLQCAFDVNPMQECKYEIRELRFYFQKYIKKIKIIHVMI